MNSLGANQPFMALVDDDSHTARLMIRMLLAHGAPSVSWLDGEAQASAEFGRLLDDSSATLPCMVIVDLKATDTATEEFVAKLRAMPDGRSLLIVAMSSSVDREVRGALLRAGADAVFDRQPDINFYRREVAAMVTFWVRNQRLDAVGA